MTLIHPPPSPPACPPHNFEIPARPSARCCQCSRAGGRALTRQVEATGARWHTRCALAAASLGLEWYAEHTQDAIAFPGKHPNIDRLLAWSKGAESYQARLLAA